MDNFRGNSSVARGGREGPNAPKPFKKRKEGKMIMFDREKRIDFVTGFKKRKDERRF